MTLYHATPRQNLDSIFMHGLQPENSKGKQVAIWMHTKSKQAWTLLHIASHQKVHPNELVLLEVRIPRNRLQRRRRGIWITKQPIESFKIVQWTQH